MRTGLERFDLPPLTTLREHVAATIHGDDCTCPHSVEEGDLRVADRVLAHLAVTLGFDVERMAEQLRHARTALVRIAYDESDRTEYAKFAERVARQALIAVGWTGPDLPDESA